MRVCDQPKTTSSTAESESRPMTRPEPQPHEALWASGSSSETNVALSRTAPTRSRRPPLRVGASGTTSTTATIATAPPTAVIQNSAWEVRVLGDQAGDGQRDRADVSGSLARRSSSKGSSAPWRRTPTSATPWSSAEPVAVVQLAGDSASTDADLLAEAGRHVARYKVPKAIVRVPLVERSPSGRADYRWARAQVPGDG